MNMKLDVVNSTDLKQVTEEIESITFSFTGIRYDYKSCLQLALSGFTN